MFQLTGKVGLDASGFYRALTGMKAAAAPLGNQIAKQLGSRFMSFFGAGSFVNQFRKTLSGAFDIRKEAGKLGLETTTFQTLSKLADETGADINDMIAKLEEGGFANAIEDANAELLKTGVIIEEDTVKKLAGLQDKLNELGGRKAVVAAQITDVAIGAYDWVAKNVFEHGVGSFYRLKGILTGDKDLDAAGREMLGLSPSTDPTDSGPAATSGYQAAKGMITNLPKAVADGVVKALKDPAVKEERQSRLEGSGDTAFGRYFGKGSGLTPVENQLRLLNRTVYDMNRKLGNVL